MSFAFFVDDFSDPTSGLYGYEETQGWGYYDAKTKRFKTEIPVDEVRRLRSFLNLTAAQDQWRVVLIDTADDLNANAANSPSRRATGKRSPLMHGLPVHMAGSIVMRVNIMIEDYSFAERVATPDFW